MRPVFVWDDEMAAYDFGPGHPLDPVRVELTVALVRAYGLDASFDVVAPDPADHATLALVHDASYIAAVEEAGAHPSGFMPRMGLGYGDNPVFRGMHEASARVVGGTVAGMAEALSGGRALNVAGGLHHAMPDRASGFCVYNDPAVAIAWALWERPDVRVMYVDVDAHHGDGVQAAFYAEPRVLTVSLHESGRYLFPGSGYVEETGEGEAAGTSANVPMPPMATDACYDLAFRELVEPLARAFAPDVVVGQFGCDAHHADPLTSLGMTLHGHARLVDGVVRLADELAEGRLLALGGGGYALVDVVPRAWTLLAARLAEADLPDPLPESWRERASKLTADVPRRLREDPGPEVSASREAVLLADVERTVAEARALLFPHHALVP